MTRGLSRWLDDELPEPLRQAMASAADDGGDDAQIARVQARMTALFGADWAAPSAPTSGGAGSPQTASAGTSGSSAALELAAVLRRESVSQGRSVGAVPMAVPGLVPAAVGIALVIGVLFGVAAVSRMRDPAAVDRSASDSARPRAAKPAASTSRVKPEARSQPDDQARGLLPATLDRPASTGRVQPMKPRAPVRPAPQPARPAPQPAPQRAPRVEGGGLAEEVRALDAIRRHLRDAPLRALAESEKHERVFARGVLAPERELLRIEILCALGRNAEARARAEAFAQTPEAETYRAELQRIRTRYAARGCEPGMNREGHAHGDR